MEHISVLYIFSIATFSIWFTRSYVCLHIVRVYLTILTPWSWALLERSHHSWNYSRTSQHFMEPRGSLPCSQEPSTGPHPEPDQSNPYHPILSLEDPSWYYPPTYVSVFLVVGLFLSGVPTNNIYAFILSPFVLLALPTHRDPPRWPRDTLYPQTLALTSPTCGGHSVGIVRPRTKAAELLYYYYLLLGDRVIA
jgi:hypothetical protein